MYPRAPSTVLLLGMGIAARALIVGAKQSEPQVAFNVGQQHVHCRWYTDATVAPSTLLMPGIKHTPKHL